jgi:hypothetical protein
VEHFPLDDGIATREGIGEPLQPELREHRMARRRSDVDADRPQDDVVGLPLLPLARQGSGVDGLLAVWM